MPLDNRSGPCGQTNIMTLMDMMCQQYGNCGKGVSILNVGARNDSTVWEFIKRGFVHLDVLDSCKATIELMKEKALYDNYFICDYLYREFPIEDCVYDVVVHLGNIRDSQITGSTIRQLARVTKPGGLVITCLSYDSNNDTYSKSNIEATFMELQTDNVLECVNRQLINSSSSKVDVVYTFRKL